MSNPNSTAQRAGRRYTRDMGVAAALYTAFVLGGGFAIDGLELPRWAVIALAVAPLFPALLMLRAYLIFLNQIDEFQRRIQTDAMLCSAAVVGFGSFAYGFLESWAGFPDLPLVWILPALIAVWSFAAAVLRMRYK
jgi:hypothetical protein